MNGYQLTFYTEQNRRHGHRTVCEWLLHEVRELGIGGATVINCAEGIGHAGAHHAAHVLKLADQPVQIILAVTEEEAERLLTLVRAENVHVFYVRSPIEFGLIGDDAPQKSSRHFPHFGKPACQRRRASPSCMARASTMFGQFFCHVKSLSRWFDFGGDRSLREFARASVEVVLSTQVLLSVAARVLLRHRH